MFNWLSRKRKQFAERAGRATNAAETEAERQALTRAVVSLATADNETNGEPVTLDQVIEEIASISKSDGTHPWENWGRPGFVLRQANLQTFSMTLSRLLHNQASVEDAMAIEIRAASFIRGFFEQEIASGDPKHNLGAVDCLIAYLIDWEPEAHRLQRLKRNSP